MQYLLCCRLPARPNRQSCTGQQAVHRCSLPQPAALQIWGAAVRHCCATTSLTQPRSAAETMPPAGLQAESEARQAATAQVAEQRKDAAAAERQLRAYYEGRLRERNRELAAARMHVQVRSLVGLGALEGLVRRCTCVGAGCCQDAPAGPCVKGAWRCGGVALVYGVFVGEGHCQDASAGKS